MYKLYKLKYFVNKFGPSLWGGDACGSAWWLSESGAEEERPHTSEEVPGLSQDAWRICELYWYPRIEFWVLALGWCFVIPK